MTPFELLQVLAAGSETGMLFARTTQGHQVRIGIAAGQIVHVSYAMRRGGEALSRLAGAQAVSASFTRGLVAERHDDLPPQDLLLQMLATILGSGLASLAPPTGPNTVPTRAEGPTTTRQHTDVGATTRPHGDVGVTTRTRAAEDTRRSAAVGQLRRLMVDYVGPIGGLLVDQEMEAGFHTWTELVDRLAREVSPDAEVQAFRIAALRLLR
ncbi:MAG TPA: DUF4388 domain-containing protein [Burkholderiaceae bacterium]|nr:DUF4388 domain-containing protein [Burkholderiaceae bacterium]